MVDLPVAQRVVHIVNFQQLCQRYFCVLLLLIKLFPFTLCSYQKHRKVTATRWGKLCCRLLIKDWAWIMWRYLQDAYCTITSTSFLPQLETSINKLQCSWFVCTHLWFSVTIKVFGLRFSSNVLSKYLQGPFWLMRMYWKCIKSIFISILPEPVWMCT